MWGAAELLVAPFQFSLLKIWAQDVIQALLTLTGALFMASSPEQEMHGLCYVKQCFEVPRNVITNLCLRIIRMSTFSLGHTYERTRLCA